MERASRYPHQMSSEQLLQAGEKAPPFKIRTFADHDLSMRGLEGSLVYLALFRYAACPFCNLRVHRLVEAREKLAAQDVQTIAVFPSSLEMVDKYIHRYRPPFHVVADPEERIHTLYHAQKSFMGLLWMGLKVMTTARAMSFAPNGMGARDSAIDRMPAEFLIGRDQTIHRAYYGSRFDDHLELDDVYAWAEDQD